MVPEARCIRPAEAAAISRAPALLRATLTRCVLLVVALAAFDVGAAHLHLSPTCVLAHYLPVQQLA
ncbi:MAG: hypothetical protein M3O34_17600 [Chloroflexota bacterium]|nr:hypothetical protein [Chloroflexota bacterium]